MVLADKAHIQQSMGIHEASSARSTNANHRKPQHGDPGASGRYATERRDAGCISHFGLNRSIRHDDPVRAFSSKCLTDRQLIGS